MSLSSTLYAWQYYSRQWIAARLWQLSAGPGKEKREAFELSASPARVLIVMAGLIGDTVMSTPLIIEARRLWPQSEIVLLGQKHNCDLLSACPLLDSIVETPAIPFSLRKRKEAFRLKEWLKEKKFDIALIALGDQFAASLAEAAIPVRAGVRGHVLEPCLTHTYDIGSPRTWGPAERLNALSSLGLPVEAAAPRLWVSDEARASVGDRLALLGIDREEDYIAVHPFGSTRRQWWPVERVEKLAEEIRNRYRMKTLLVGGPETRSEVSDSPASSIVNAAGLFSLCELSAALERARIVISTDSGPFHIAGALRRPAVGLFRASRPEHSSRYETARVVFGSADTCSGHCTWDRCSWQPCRQMRALSTEDVAAAIEEILKADS